MHFLKVFLIGAALATAASATTYTFTDPYAGQSAAGSGNGDVIGLFSKFDIESLNVSNTGSAVTMTVKMNYNNGSTSLASFLASDGTTTLRPGDLMFTSGGLMWAVALATHGVTNAVASPTLTAGSLYRVTGFETAQTVLGNPAGITYRNNSDVWGNPTGATLENGGSVSTSLLGGNEIQVVISFNSADAAFTNALTGGNFAFEFAAATCANDVLSGSPVPEPASLGLAGAGLVALGLLRRKRPQA